MPYSTDSFESLFSSSAQARSRCVGGRCGGGRGRGDGDRPGDRTPGARGDQGGEVRGGREAAERMGVDPVFCGGVEVPVLMDPLPAAEVFGEPNREWWAARSEGRAHSTAARMTSAWHRAGAHEIVIRESAKLVRGALAGLDLAPEMPPIERDDLVAVAVLANSVGVSPEGSSADMDRVGRDLIALDIEDSHRLVVERVRYAGLHLLETSSPRRRPWR